MRPDAFYAATARQIAREFAGLEPGPGFDAASPIGDAHLPALSPIGRRLSIAGGSRKDAKAEAALVDVVKALKASSEPQSGRRIKNELKESDHSRAAIEAALKLGAEGGELAMTDGPKGAKLYSSGTVPVSRSVPPVFRNTPSECPSVPVLIEARDAGHTISGDTADADVDCF